MCCGGAVMKKIRLSKTERLLDKIKDSIDRIREIKSPPGRRTAARELIDYIELHHLDQ